MKYKRFFSILAGAVVLAMLMIAIPVTPAVASPIVTLSVTKGEIGDKVTVEGSGFSYSDPQNEIYHAVNIYFSADFIDIGDDIDYYDNTYKVLKQYIYTDSSGTITKTFTVPSVLDDSRYSASVHGGTYYVYMTYTSDESVEAYAEFTVIGVTDFSPTGGPVGSTLEVSGVGFDANENIVARYDGTIVEIVSGDQRFKSNGTFTSQIEIPESAAGEHTVEFADTTGHSDQFQFTVEPEISLSTSHTSPTEAVTITGTGFGADTDIFVYFDGDEIYIIGDSDTDSRGSFEASFMVPEVDPGSYNVEVEDNSFDFAVAVLDVGAGLTISPATTAADPGHVGDVVTISGVGFKSDSTITITYASDPVEFYTTSLADGSFSYDLTVPSSTAGEHTITVTDGVSSNTASFFMESTPPQAPLLVEPIEGEKASANADFDWGEVSDDSLPISYDLQVATNSQFGTESILVYKTGLTSSEYILTDEEALESAGEEAPYYWRVRAKDAASNAGEWTSGESFTVGFSFSMPGWLKYLLMSIGAVAIFFLGIWVGRRSVPSEDYW